MAAGADFRERKLCLDKKEPCKLHIEEKTKQMLRIGDSEVFTSEEIYRLEVPYGTDNSIRGAPHESVEAYAIERLNHKTGKNDATFL